MTMPRKGSRGITVLGEAYRWRVSPWKTISDWHQAVPGELDPQWLDEARRFGLGDVADVTFAITIEAENDHASKIRVTYHALVVDGFLGPEQFTQIKPRLVRALIERAIESGWSPRGLGDCSMEIVEKAGRARGPALLVLPGLSDEVEGYQRRVIPIQITLGCGEP